jgi:predicted transposase/invertase (TIGR01784 family)
MATQKHIRFDWAMKKLLRNKANFDILEGFLSELLMFDVKIQEILESESNKEEEDDKFNRVDILVKNTNNELMLIEVQNEKEDDYFHRMNYGQAKLTTEHLWQGNRYDELKKVFSINIVYFELGQGKDYVYVGHTSFKGLHFQDELQLSAKQKQIYPVQNVADIFTTYYIIKVNKFDKIAENTLDEWIYFLKTSEIKDEFQAKGLREANQRMRIDSLNNTERQRYEKWLKEERIRESEIQTAFTDGLQKAKDEFTKIIETERKLKEEERRQKEESIRKLALKMLKYGEPIDEIIRETGLNSDDIEKLE